MIPFESPQRCQRTPRKWVDRRTGNNERCVRQLAPNVPHTERARKRRMGFRTRTHGSWRFRPRCKRASCGTDRERAGTRQLLAAARHRHAAARTICSQTATPNVLHIAGGGRSSTRPPSRTHIGTASTGSAGSMARAESLSEPGFEAPSTHRRVAARPKRSCCPSVSVSGSIPARTDALATEVVGGTRSRFRSDRAEAPATNSPGEAATAIMTSTSNVARLTASA